VAGGPFGPTTGALQRVQLVRDDLQVPLRLILTNINTGFSSRGRGWGRGRGLGSRGGGRGATAAGPSLPPREFNRHKIMFQATNSNSAPQPHQPHNQTVVDHQPGERSAVLLLVSQIGY
jgi:hypothetical protein